MGGPAILSAKAGIGAVQAVLNGLLILFISLLLGKTLWVLASPNGAVARSVVVPAASANISSTAARAPIDKSILSSENPFSYTDLPIGEDFLEQAPETDLNVVLKGVRHSTSDGESAAYVTLPDGQDAFLSIGDEILDNVYIERILLNQIMIRRNGALESLGLDSDEERAILDYADPEAEADYAVLSSGTNANSRSERGQRLARGRSEQTIQTEISDPAALLTAVNFSPVLEDEQQIGYKVSSRGDAQLMRDVGFQPGDIIQSINSRAVSNFNDRELADTLSFSQRLRFGVLRDTNLLQIIVVVKEV